MSSYQPGIPSGTVNLDVDYQNIQANFQQLDTSFGVDHVPFSDQTAQNGYHTSIHLNPISTTATNPPNNQPVVPPSTVSGFGQVFSSQINDGIATDEALYFLSGGGKLSQLTRNFQPVANSAGRTFLPGGLILQWGVVTTNFSSSTGSVVFPLVMPTSLYNVQITMKGTSGTANLVQVTGFTSNSPSGFKGFGWQFTAGSGTSFTGFYWTAIGI